MQPYFFPYLGYFQLIDAADKFILYNNINYIKKSWMTRNRILIKNDKPFYLRVPVVASSSNRMIHEIEIFNNAEWKQAIIKSISHNYKKAPFYDEIFPLISGIIYYESKYLYKLNAHCIKKISEFLDIKTQILNADSDYNELEKTLNTPDVDLFKRFRYLKVQNYEKKIIRILEICRSMEAETYINAIGGKSLYSKEEFRKNNISLYFLNTNPDLIYTQLSKSFFPGLSVIDVLMNCGKENTKKHLKKYTLI